MTGCTYKFSETEPYLVQLLYPGGWLIGLVAEFGSIGAVGTDWATDARTVYILPHDTGVALDATGQLASNWCTDVACKQRFKVVLSDVKLSHPTEGRLLRRSELLPTSSGLPISPPVSPVGSSVAMEQIADADRTHLDAFHHAVCKRDAALLEDEEEGHSYLGCRSSYVTLWQRTWKAERTVVVWHEPGGSAADGMRHLPNGHYVVIAKGGGGVKFVPTPTEAEAKAGAGVHWLRIQVQAPSEKEVWVAAKVAPVAAGVPEPFEWGGWIPELMPDGAWAMAPIPLNAKTTQLNGKEMCELVDLRHHGATIGVGNLAIADLQTCFKGQASTLFYTNGERNEFQRIVTGSIATFFGSITAPKSAKKLYHHISIDAPALPLGLQMCEVVGHGLADTEWQDRQPILQHARVTTGHNAKDRGGFVHPHAFVGPLLQTHGDLLDNQEQHDQLYRLLYCGVRMTVA